MAESSQLSAGAPVPLGPMVHWRLTPRSAVAVVAAEVRKGLASMWSHPAGFLLSLFIAATVYLGMQFLIGQGELPRDLMARTVVAFGAMWFLFHSSLVMVVDLSEEGNTGTLEQAHVTPVPPGLLMLGRLGTATVQGLVASVLAVVVPLLVVRMTIPLNWQALVPFSLTLANGLAFAFLFSGIALVQPNVAQLHFAVAGMVSMLNGAYLPVDLLPGWLQAVVQVVPTTLGLRATLATLYDGESLGDLWADGSLAWLIAYTAGLTLVGWWVYVRNHRAALRDGRLARY